VGADWIILNNTAFCQMPLQGVQMIEILCIVRWCWDVNAHVYVLFQWRNL